MMMLRSIGFEFSLNKCHHRFDFHLIKNSTLHSSHSYSFVKRNHCSNCGDYQRFQSSHPNRCVSKKIYYELDGILNRKPISYLNRIVQMSHSSLASEVVFRPPSINQFKVTNEPILEYGVGSSERNELRNKLKYYFDKVTEIPIVIGGKQYKTNETLEQRLPFDHGHVLARAHLANDKLISQAIKSSLEHSKQWENVDINKRVEVLLKAADLVSGKYRQDLNAATMLGQGKTIIQAEIDSAAELADFFRFNAYYVREVYQFQPSSPSPDVVRNTFRIRGLEGFVAAISPFNFTAIAGNLCTAPALMGNAVLWKPSNTAILSNWIIFKILEEAEFAPGVISFLPSTPASFSQNALTSPDLAAVNFTGSVATFRSIWKTVATNLDQCKTFPRLVGECGGKDFHFIHPSAEIENVAVQTIRAAFEYSGQKCSACSRLYAPRSMWPKLKDRLLEIVKQIKLGSPLEFDTFLSAVIDEASFKRNTSFLLYAKSQNQDHEILFGGNKDDRTGFFIEPTIILTSNPFSKLMSEEIFGPILTVFVYEDNKIEETLQLLDRSTPFGLTGSIFANDLSFLKQATEKLKYSAGNFYINDKCTGAVVGQQPFGGARLSGTNDKAGSPLYLFRWASPQNIKQNFVPSLEWKYSYMSSSK